MCDYYFDFRFLSSISINLKTEFRVVPIAKVEHFLEKGHSGTIPKSTVHSEQISSILVAGLGIYCNWGPRIVRFESISVPMACYIMRGKGIYLDS